MEPFPLFITITLIFLTLIMVLINKKKFHYKPKAQTSGSPFPPGPSCLPLIGSLHHLIFAGPFPHRTLRDLAGKHGPLMLMRLGQVDHLIVSSREAAEEIMKTHDVNFASRPVLAVAETLTYGYADLVFSPYGAHWRTMRKITVTELLTLHRVRSFQSVREEEITNLVAGIHLAGQNPVDLRATLTALANNIVCRAAFGADLKNRERLLVLMKEGLRLTSGFAMADLFPSFKFVDYLSGMKLRAGRLHRKIDEILEGAIRDGETRVEARGEEAENLLDQLLRIKDSGELEVPITTDKIKAVIIDLFAGGTETTSMTLEWAMAELMRSPEAMRKAQDEARRVAKGKAKVEESDVAELKFIGLVIKETLRLHPPFPALVPKVGRDACTIQGYAVPAGCRVIVNAWALGRDPKYWDEPERFRPERFQGAGAVDFRGAHFELVPFGAGRRICPGINFASATMELALAQLLFCFDWKLPRGMKPEDLDMSEASGISAPRKSPLVLLATPYVVCSPSP